MSDALLPLTTSTAACGIPATQSTNVSLRLTISRSTDNRQWLALTKGIGMDPESLVPTSIQAGIRRLERPHDWDEEGADAITRGDCEAAVRLVGYVRWRVPAAPLPRFGPSVHGGVSLYWRSAESFVTVRVVSGEDRPFMHEEWPTGQWQDSRPSWGDLLGKLETRFSAPLCFRR